MVDRFGIEDGALEIEKIVAGESVKPLTPQGSQLDAGAAGYTPRSLPFADGSQAAVFSLGVLQRASDPRGALQECFRVLRVGGHLTLVVPHQFLYERKLQPPSAFDADHKRFYTCASLMREIEEALEPSTFRVRWLEENDQGFDVLATAEDQDQGGCEIICVLEKIGRPAWVDALLHVHSVPAAKAFRRQPSQTGWVEPIKVIASAAPEVKRILVMKLDHRGDFIMGVDAFEALRRDFPNAHITLACGPWNVVDAGAMGLFDQIAPFALFAENASQERRPYSTLLQAQLAFNRALGEQPFDLAIDLRWDDDTRFLLETVQARHRAGFGAKEMFSYLDIALNLRRETVDGRAERRLISAERFMTPMLDHRGYAIVMAERWDAGPAFLVFGPYERMAAGDYWIDLFIEPLEEPFTVPFDIVADRSATVIGLGELEVTRAGRTRVPVTLAEEVADLEIRIKAGSAAVGPFRFLGCMILRAGSLQGVHQREAMYTLVQVVSARMRNPYLEREAQDIAGGGTT